MLRRQICIYRVSESADRSSSKFYIYTFHSCDRDETLPVGTATIDSIQDGLESQTRMIRKRSTRQAQKRYKEVVFPKMGRSAIDSNR